MYSAAARMCGSLRGVAGEPQRDIGLDRRRQVAGSAVEVAPGAVVALLRADPVRAARPSSSGSRIPRNSRSSMSSASIVTLVSSSPFHQPSDCCSDRQPVDCTLQRDGTPAASEVSVFKRPITGQCRVFARAAKGIHTVASDIGLTETLAIPVPNSNDSGKSEINDLTTLRAAHAGQALALNQRYLNRQLGRVLQTLGFDREWVRGEGPYLIDSAGESYLDLYAGYGVFGLGRNHPFVKAQLHALLDSDPPSLPQLGVSTLAGLLAERLVRAGPGLDRCSRADEFGHRSGRGRAQAGPGGDRTDTDPVLRARLPRALLRLALGQRQRGVPGALRALPARLRPGAVRRPRRAEAELDRGDVAGFIVEPVQGKGVYPAPDGYLAGAQKLCREAGALLILDEVQTGLGRTGRFLALEHWGVEPDMITLSKGSVGRIRAGRRAAHHPRGVRQDLLFDGAQRRTRLHLRRQRFRRRCRPRQPDGDRAGGPGGTRRGGSASC